VKKKKKKIASKKPFLGRLTLVYITLCLLIALPGFLGWMLLGKAEAFCANSITCINDLSGKFEEGKTTGIFMGRQVSVPTTLLAQAPQTAVLGSTTEKKRIAIDLSTQTLYAYEGDKVVYTFPVSTGKWGRTPTGKFNIWVKLRATRMAGGHGADAYDLPNVPYTMFFANNEIAKSQGYSIHGAYWHNNFGHPMSHGCINMRIEDAAVMYSWADPPTVGNTTYATKDNHGTEVVISGETPNE